MQKHILFNWILFFILANTISGCNDNTNRVNFTINPENRAIVIPVHLNDSIIANMVFDNGWTPLALDSLFCAANPVVNMNTPDSIIQRGSAWEYDQVSCSFYKIPQAVRIGNVNLTYQNIHVLNYKHYFNIEADGVLGIPQEDTTHVWELNFENNYLEIHQADVFKMPENCFILPFIDYFTVNFPMQIEYSNGDTLTMNCKYFIDTGMPQDIVLVRPTKEAFDFFNKRDDAVWTTSDGVKYSRRYTVRATLFNNFFVDSLRIYFLDNPRKLGGEGMIGQNFLKRFNVFFDMKNRQLGLQPIKNFKRIVNPNHRRFYFSEYKSPEGKYFVKMLADYKDNPYKLAGLREGDEFISLNGKLFKDLTYEDILERDKAESFQMVILRNGEYINIVVPVDINFDRVD